MDEDNVMLEKEFHAPYKAWKTAKNPQTTGAMLRAVQPIMKTAVRTYVGPNASPVMHSKAKRLTIEALERYDPTRAKLKTHLMSHLQGLRRLNAQQQQIIGVPERVGLDLYHLNRSNDELRDRLGREPSTPELADHTGLSVKRIAYIRRAQPGISEGAMQQPNEEGTAGSGPAVADPLENSHILKFVYPDLHPTDQLILEHSMGLHGREKLSKQQIAAKLRLSPGAVSQRAAKIQEKLDRATEMWPGGPDAG